MTAGGYESSVGGHETPYQGFAARLRTRESLIGYWIALDSPVSTERIGRLGFDYVAFDAQHGLIGYDGLLRGLMAVDAGGRAVGVVRVGANDQYLIGRALDAGAAAVIVPLIDNAAQAAQAIRYTRYAPTGARSYGPIRAGFYGGLGTYHTTANDSLLILPQIETAEAVDNIEAILDVPGISGVYVGPSDLGLSLGMPPVMDREEPHILAIYERILAATAQRGLIAGIHNASAAYAARMERMGFRFLTVATDINLIGAGTGQAVHTVRALREDASGAEPAR